MSERRKVRSSSAFVSMSGGRRFRLHLECDHTVARSKVMREVRCEYCGSDAKKDRDQA